MVEYNVNEPRLIDLTLRVDDRGHLYEVCHNYDLVNGRFGQVYCVQNPGAGAIRAYHRHQVLWDYFTIVSGRAIFCLIGPDRKKSQRYTIDARKPQMLVVPPGWYHGWVSLVDDTILLSVGSELYDRESPDEERVPWDSFNSLFGDRNPFEVWAK